MASPLKCLSYVEWVGVSVRTCRCPGQGSVLALQVIVLLHGKKIGCHHAKTISLLYVQSRSASITPMWVRLPDMWRSPPLLAVALSTMYFAVVFQHEQGASELSYAFQTEASIISATDEIVLKLGLRRAHTIRTLLWCIRQTRHFAIYLSAC